MFGPSVYTAHFTSSMEIVKKGIMATPRWIFHRINIISCFEQCPVHFGTSARIPKIINEKKFRGYIFF